MRFLILFLCSTWLYTTVVVAESLPPRNNEIRSAIETFLLQKTVGADFEARIKRLSIPTASNLPLTGELDYEIIAPPQWEGWGNVNLAVVVRLGDRVVRNIPVRLEVDALTDMVVATRQIDHGATLTAADLAVRKQEIATTKGEYFKRTEDLLGRRARVTLRSNRPIKPDQVEKVAVIRAGQIVSAIMEQATLRITITARAKQAGAIGDTITVQNISSLKEFPARIIDANTVQALL